MALPSPRVPHPASGERIMSQNLPVEGRESVVEKIRTQTLSKRTHLPPGTSEH